MENPVLTVLLHWNAVAAVVVGQSNHYLLLKKERKNRKRKDILHRAKFFFSLSPNFIPRIIHSFRSQTQHASTFFPSSSAQSRVFFFIYFFSYFLNLRTKIKDSPFLESIKGF